MATESSLVHENFPKQNGANEGTSILVCNAKRLWHVAKKPTALTAFMKNCEHTIVLLFLLVGSKETRQTEPSKRHTNRKESRASFWINAHFQDVTIRRSFGRLELLPTSRTKSRSQQTQRCGIRQIKAVLASAGCGETIYFLHGDGRKIRPP